MSISSSLTPPVRPLNYRDVGFTLLQDESVAEALQDHAPERAAALAPSSEEMEAMLLRARADAEAYTRERMSQSFKTQLDDQIAKVHQAIERFRGEQESYFARVEEDVVKLALTIAGRVLHREAQVDPLLIATLVRVALEKLREGSKVSIYVPSGESQRWREALLPAPCGLEVEVAEDPSLPSQDCMVKTELGSARFGIDAQMKEIEQGFFDLLSQRPVVQ